MQTTQKPRKAVIVTSQAVQVGPYTAPAGYQLSNKDGLSYDDMATIVGANRGIFRSGGPEGMNDPDACDELIAAREWREAGEKEAEKATKATKGGKPAE